MLGERCALGHLRQGLIDGFYQNVDVFTFP
jgi:hypothetical protein